MGQIRELQKRAYDIATDKGWWDEGNEASFGENIALMHSELSEALESYREDGLNPHIGVEFADVVIRIMDVCEYIGIDLETAIIQKMRQNADRPYRHGGKLL